MAKQQRSGAISKKKHSSSDACVFCGQPFGARPLRVKVKERTFPVCSETCKHSTQDYLAKDKKYKLPLFLVIFVAAIVIMLTALRAGNMLGAHVMQVLVGLAFMVWPYPVANFTTFERCPIVTTKRIIRVVGFALAAFGIILVVHLRQP